MKRTTYWVCSAVILALAVLLIAFYGATLKTVLLVCVFLVCPAIGGMVLLLSKQTERDIRDAVKKAVKQR